ncbi:unnamed protein product [Cuscuta campestris]|uniref:Uncharacterized protein n=1 Tax=Cuscuta campestris TaxID=132261 RepID=A0A484L796_9ASTE|nr:unnamed protein product [Cuscuta campestris]
MVGRRTRRNPATSAQSTVRSDNPEQGMIVPVNGLETTLNNVANMMANIMERLDKALPGPSGTRDIPTGQPRQVLRTASSPILQELHDPEEVERERRAIDRRRAEELARISKKAHVSERLGKNPEKAPQGWIRPQASQVASSNREPRQRNGRGASQVLVRSLRNLEDDEAQSQARIPASRRLGPPLPETGEFQDLRQQIQEMQRKINKGRVFTTQAWRILKNFLIRWRKESREGEETDDKSRLAMFTAALQDGLLRTDLTTHPPDTFEEAMVRAGRYVTLEERKEEKKEKTRKEEEKLGSKKSFKNKKQGFPDGPKGANPGTLEKHKSANPVFTLPVAEVMAHAAQQGLMTYPTYSQKVCNVEDTGKWCAYHRKNDHNTEDCYTLKNEMARLIRRGHLNKFVQDGDAGNPGNAQNGKRRDKEVAQAEAREKRHIGLEDEEEDLEPAPHRQKRHHGCNFIIGGNTGGDSATSRKKWANAAMVNKVLVPEEGVITLPVEIGDTKATRKLNMEFVVVGIISSTDIILGRPGLEDLECVISPRHLCIKFPTPHGVGIARGSQRVSRAWYLKATKQPVKYDTQVGEVTAQLLRAEEKRPRVEVAGDIEEVELEPGTPGRLVRIGKDLGAELRSRVISVLRRFRRVFAWSPADMPGLDHKIAVHRLNVLPDAKPVKQKRRHLSQERRGFVKKEVATLQSIGHIRELAEKAHPFFAVIKKKATFEWTQECLEAFEELKRYLTSPPVLSKPEPGDILTLYLAIADCAITTVIVREERGAQHPVYYVSKTLRDAELRYSRPEKAMLAVFWTAKRLTPYFQAHRIIVLTNEPLASLTRSPTASARMTKWAVFIGQYNVEFRPRPSIKGQALADFQVECTAREMTRAQFRVSNNEAEYEALINGLKILSKMGVSRVQVYSDSRLVVGQITGEFEAKEERMKRYRDLSLEMLGRFEFKLEHIPRAQNAEADVLSKLSAESPEYISKLATIEELVTPSLSNSEVIWVSADPPEWLDRLAKYIEDGEAPKDPQKARLLRMRAPTYKVQDGILYKRSHNGVLLRCLRAAEAKALMEEIHEGVCAAHQGPYSISRRAIIQGYFWPTMRKDCEEYVRKCPTCQQFQNIPGRPATNYTPISSVIPFSRWGIDLVGALPKGAGQARWIVVAIDYFTKWVEAEPLAGITGRQMIDFVGTNILCRFVVPKQIISDNGTQFEEAEFQDFLKTWGIQHTKVSVAYPQANGQVENVNRTIIDGIKKKLLSEGTKWVDELPRILWTYRTTPMRATGDTPFGLAYGFEARAPAEVVIPTRREMGYDPEVNEQNQAVELNFVEERRDEARIRAENYRRQVKSYFDNKVVVHMTAEGKGNLEKKASHQRPAGKLLSGDCVSSADEKCQDSEKKLPPWHC